jgi:hypothetical protein
MLLKTKGVKIGSLHPAISELWRAPGTNGSWR